MFTSILLTILVFPHGESLASQGDDNTDFVQRSALASNKELGGEVVDAAEAGLKPQQQHHHQAHKRSKQSKKKADSNRTGARIVMGGGETRCKPEFQITDQSDCNAAAGLLSAIKIKDDQSGEIDVSTSDQVSDQHIPTGCSYVPMSGSDHRRRQVRWNTHDKNKRNHDVGPLCDTSGLSGDETIVEGKGTVCRINADGQGEGTNGNGATCGGTSSDVGCVGCNPGEKWCPTGMTMETCEQSCRDVIAAGGNCYGYEFKSTDGRCEIWPSQIAWQKPTGSSVWSCIRIAA